MSVESIKGYIPQKSVDSETKIGYKVQEIASLVENLKADNKTGIEIVLLLSNKGLSPEEIYKTVQTAGFIVKTYKLNDEIGVLFEVSDEYKKYLKINRFKVPMPSIFWLKGMRTITIAGNTPGNTVIDL